MTERTDTVRAPRRFELDDIYALRVPSDAQLSPDATRVAFVLTEADRDRDEIVTSIWTVPTQGGEPAPLTRGRHDSCPRWSADGSTLAFLSEQEGEDRTSQIWLLQVGHDEPKRLTELPGGAGTPVWSPTGDRIAFAQKTRIDPSSTAPIEITRLGYREDGVGIRPTTGDDLFVVDVESGDATRLVDGGRFAPPMVDFAPTPVWSPDGSTIAHSWSEGSGDLPYTFVTYLIRATGGHPQRLTQRSSFLIAQDWSPDGEHLVVWGQETYFGERALAQAFTVRLENGELHHLATDLDRSVIGGSRFSSDGTEVVLSVNDRGAMPVLAVPLDGGAPRTLIGGERSGWGVSVAKGLMATVVSDTSTSGEIETITIDGGEARRLTHLFSEALPDVLLFEPEERTFEAADGSPVQAWIIRPEEGGSSPALLDVHGGPHMAWGPVFSTWDVYHQSLAAKGWTILKVNPRGSDGYGERYMRDGSWGEHDDTDLLAVVDAMVDADEVDPDRVAVAGYSYGGYMTCLITALHDRFSAAVAGGVITDLASRMWSSDLGLIETIEQDSDPWSDPDRWRQTSPITHVRNVRCPTLILHGALDDRCPLNQAEAWFLALRQQGIPVELVVYPGGSHAFRRIGPPSQRIDYYRRLEDWVLTHSRARVAETALD